MFSASLSDHQHIFSRHVDTLVAATGRKIAPPEMCLEITAGLQRDCTRTLQTKHFTIGAMPDCDVVLLDETAPPIACEISVQRSFLGPILKFSGVDDIKIRKDGEDAVEVNQPHALPIEIVICENIVIRLSAKRNISTVRSFLVAHLGNATDAKIAAIRSITVPMVVASMYFLVWLPSSPKLEMIPKQNAEFNANTNTPSGTDMKTEINKLLLSVGMSDVLGLQSASDGALKLHGLIPEARLAGYQTFNRELDLQMPRAMLLRDVSVSRDLGSLPAIRLIRISQPSYILLGNNRKVFVGDDIKEGWQVTLIGGDYLLLDHKGMTTRVEF